MSESGQPPDPHLSPRVFLVVVDESEEMRNALRYACRRAQHTNGRVALLLVVEPAEFQHWLGVGRVIEEEARRRWPGLRVEILHRLGPLEVGEASVVIAVASAHRAEGFEALRYAIDTLKERVPIWKKEIYEDGHAWIEGS